MRDWNLHASVPMIVTDLDQDGDGDLIFGKGHDYGLLWWQNEGIDTDGKIQWKERMIDKEFQPTPTLWRGQTSMAMATPN